MPDVRHEKNGYNDKETQYSKCYTIQFYKYIYLNI